MLKLADGRLRPPERPSQFAYAIVSFCRLAFAEATCQFAPLNGFRLPDARQQPWREPEPRLFAELCACAHYAVT